MLETADAMVSTGLAKLGFEYVNLDAGWLTSERHPNTSELVPVPSKWRVKTHHSTAFMLTCVFEITICIYADTWINIGKHCVLHFTKAKRDELSVRQNPRQRVEARGLHRPF